MQYEKPSVADHGTLRELTAVTFPGLPIGMATVSSPIVPGPHSGGGDTPTPFSPAGGPPGPTPSVVTPDSGLLGGEHDSGGGGDVSSGGGGGGVAGAESAGGSAGDTAASLPFTGFAAAMVAALGAGMAASGAALRRALRRQPK
jgi:hypothetical protein